MKTKLFASVVTAVHLHFAASIQAGAEYVAHEWGTFTSVQGADGIQLGWNPLIVSELPKFVYNRLPAAQDGRPVRFSDVAAKSGFVTLQRMETPVIYFYSAQEQRVKVSVDFPQGMVTEWYPQVRKPASGATDNAAAAGPRTIRWENVRILPRKQHEALANALPLDQTGSHYYAARETDADYLQIGTGDSRQETERFLFYRGIGNFRAPLTVTQSGSNADEIQLQNNGSEELRHFFVYAVQGNDGKFLYIPKLAAGKSQSVKLHPERNRSSLPALRSEIARQMRDALVREGLYEREAAAMVKTWDDSWFAEQGVRVLYVLPSAWTDRILPLTIDPKPREIVRVMVGRAELITPTMEWDLMKQIVRFSESDDQLRAQAVTNTRRIGLGRFLEPAARRLMAKISGAEFSKASWELLQAASQPAAEGKRIAAR
jgi:hypothetical protein